MSKKIETYDDLLEEKARLEELLKAQKALVKEDAELVKDSLRPIGHTISNVYSVVHSLTARPKTSPLVSLGLDFGVELLLKRMLLANSGWLVRVLVPYLVKNYSARLFKERAKDTLLKRLKKAVAKD